MAGRGAAWTVAALAGWATSVAAMPENVAAVVSTSSGVRFTVQVPEPRLVAEQGFQRLDLLGYGPATPPGAPALPLRLIQVAVPPVGAVTVTASAPSYRSYPGVRLEPTPEPAARGAAPGSERLIPRREAYARISGPSTPARLLGVSWLRNQRIATIAIEPARFDPVAARLDLASEVTVEVSAAPYAPRGTPAEPHDRFEGVYQDVLVNYEQGRAWRRTVVPGMPDPRATQGLSGARTLAVADTSVFVGRRWLKFAIQQSGFYKVTFGQLRNTVLFAGDTTTALDSVRLFNWPGVPVLPERNYCDTCDYREVAIAFIDKYDDGLFGNNEDAFYFYALGPNDWVDNYDASQPDTVFLDHPYETNNYYFLTVATAESPMPGPPQRIATVAQAPPGPGAITPATFRERLHFENDIEFFPDATPFYPSSDRPNSYFWEKWFWRSIDAGRSFGDVFDAPGADTTQGLRLRVRLWGLAYVDTCFDSFTRSGHIADLEWNNVTLKRYSWPQLDGFTIDTTLAGFASHGNQVRVSVPSFRSCRTDKIGFAWYDAFYQRRFQPVANELTFDTPATSAEYHFQVGPFTTDTIPRVFDLTDPYRPRELVGVQWTPSGSQWTLGFGAAQSGRRRYSIVREGSISSLSTTAISESPATSLENLRSGTRRADYLVIFYDGFQQAAATLTAWRRQHDGFETDSIPISALYDQFSGGRTDPAAIRNFLRAAATTWSLEPTYVTLLGDASYDYKNLTGRAPSGQPGTLVPTYENGWDYLEYRQFATDDWILNIDDASNPKVVVPDFLGGRIPAGDAAGALDAVRNKVIFYDQTAPLGEYRNRIMLIADDQFQGSEDDGLGFDHVQQTSVLDSACTPPHMDRVYVYLHTYPTGPGFTKPGAKDDILANLNNGVAIFNYVGHGSPFKLSDESVFLDTDVGTLENQNTLPIFIAASCDIGKFDDPTVPSLGERLVMTPGRGAIGVISATELAFSNENAALNQAIYARLFKADSSGRYDATISGALLSGKLQYVNQNSQKYQLLGDAATHPGFPQLAVELALYDSSGATPAATLDRGRTLMVRGRVLDKPGGTLQPIDGVASLLIEDSAPQLQTPSCKYCDPDRLPKFYFRAGPIFRGEVGLHGGTFESRFVVPLESVTGPRAKVRAYVKSGATAGAGVDGVGVLGGIGGVAGTATRNRLQLDPGSVPTDDHAGPRITLSFPSGATAVKPDAVLRIDLEDPSGILTTAHTPQNGIIVTLDANTTGRVDVTSSFRYAADSYQAGAATFQLPNLAEGTHTVEVSAADNLAAGLGAAAHRSKASLAFEVQSQPSLRVTQAYLFPNPIQSGGARGGGTFVVDAPGDSVNLLLKIYTVAGHLIRNLRHPGGLGQIQMPWDGLDEEGATLANGVYLFKVYVNARLPDGTSSAREKAQSTGRFVVVNGK